MPRQPSPTRVGQQEHPQDASRQAQARNLTRIGIEKAAQARRAKLFPLQRQSQPHAQDPVSKVSLHELCTEHDTAHTVLASFIDGPANKNLLPSHAHSYTQHSDATVPPSSISKFSPKIHRSLADHRLRKASGTPRFSILEAIKDITVHKRWNNSTTRFIERMMMAGLKNRTARAVSRWREAQQQPVTRHTTVNLQDARSTPCTCKGRKCQPAKSDTAHGSHMYNCELIYKWHEHGTRISHTQRTQRKPLQTALELST